MRSIPYLKLTPPDWIILGYGAVSGFGFGFWNSRDVFASIGGGIVGMVLMVAVVVVARMSVGWALADRPGVVRIAARMLVVGTLATYLLLGISDRLIVNLMAVTWLLLPMLWLGWFESRRGAARL